MVAARARRRRLGQAVRPGGQRDGRGGLAASLAEVPLVDGQGHVKPEIELVLGEKGGDSANDSFVEAARSHECVQSGIQFLLTGSVLPLVGD